MPYDTMTESEWDEYQILAANPPLTITERAERFLILAEKGWTGTRAADDCFEMGHGELVFALVIRHLKEDPTLIQGLKSQGCWGHSWQQALENWNEEREPVVVLLTWETITLECVLNPQWSSAVPDLAHLQIWSIKPDKAPLPITGTGYRSHFFRAAQHLDEETLRAWVLSWIEEEAQSPAWTKQRKSLMQLSLF